MATLKIDLGLKSFEVCDTDGNTLGTIRFNPSDPGLLPRWKDAEKRVRELASTPEGEYDTADGLAMLDREVKAQIDHAFGTGEKQLFETSVFGLPDDIHPQWRFASWTDAVNQHLQLVLMLEHDGPDSLLEEIRKKQAS